MSADKLAKQVAPTIRLADAMHDNAMLKEIAAKMVTPAAIPPGPLSGG